MTLLRVYERLLKATVFLSMFAFVAADEQVGLLLAVLPVLLLVMLRGRGKPPALLPTTAVNLLVLAAIIFAATKTTVFAGNEPVVSTLGQFLVIILLIKLFDRRHARDDAQMLSLSVFVLIASVLTSNSLVVGVLLVAVSLVWIAGQMLWHVRAGYAWSLGETGWAATSGGVDPRASSGRPGLVAGPKAGRSLRRLFIATSVACCAVALGVFVFTPRGLGADSLGQLGSPREPQIGYTDQVQLGQAGRLSDNPTPVLDVSIEGADGRLGASMLYLRGAVADVYAPESGSWTDSLPPEGETPVSAGNRWILPVARRAEGVPRSSANPISRRSMTVTQRVQTTGGSVFTQWRPLEMWSDKSFRAMRSSETATISRRDGRVPFTYSIESTIAEDLSRTPRSSLGFQDGRVHELATSVLASAPLGDNPKGRAAVSALREHLRSSDFSYTLEMIAPPQGVDPIEFFLFDSKRGHCEYFASALTAMCQANGIPARVVSGFLATEYNQLTGQYIVRQSNAHAWVEAFVIVDAEAGLGRWETFEASPQGEIERIHQPPTGMLARLRGWYETVEFGWTRSVVGFDALRQNQLFGRGNQRTNRQTAAVEEFARRLSLWMRSRGKTKLGIELSVPGWVKWALAGGAGATCLWIGLQWWRKHAPRERARRAGIDPDTAALLRQAAWYPRSLKLLKRAGVGKPDEAAPLSHARTLAAGDPELGAAFAELSELYYRVRYGRRMLTAAETARAAALVDAVERRTSARRNARDR